MTCDQKFESRKRVLEVRKWLETAIAWYFLDRDNWGTICLQALIFIEPRAKSKEVLKCKRCLEDLIPFKHGPSKIDSTLVCTQGKAQTSGNMLKTLEPNDPNTLVKSRVLHGALRKSLAIFTFWATPRNRPRLDKALLWCLPCPSHWDVVVQYTAVFETWSAGPGWHSSRLERFEDAWGI